MREWRGSVARVPVLLAVGLAAVLGMAAALDSLLVLSSVAASLFVIGTQPYSHAASPPVIARAYAIACCAGAVFSFVFDIDAGAVDGSHLVAAVAAATVASGVMIATHSLHAPAAGAAVSVGAAPFQAVDSTMMLLAVALLGVVAFALRRTTGQLQEEPR